MTTNGVPQAPSIAEMEQKIVHLKVSHYDYICNIRDSSINIQAWQKRIAEIDEAIAQLSKMIVAAQASPPSEQPAGTASRLPAGVTE